MLAADKHAAIFNDLIRINNDRIAGYETALGNVPVGEKVIEELFKDLHAQSVKFREELIVRVAVLGGAVATDSTLSGKLFRTWMDLKSAFTGAELGAIVESCAFGEEAWQKAYQTVLETEHGLPAESRLFINEQYEAGRKSAQLLENCRQVLTES